MRPFYFAVLIPAGLIVLASMAAQYARGASAYEAVMLHDEARPCALTVDARHPVPDGGSLLVIEGNCGGGTGTPLPDNQGTRLDFNDLKSGKFSLVIKR